MATLPGIDGPRKPEGRGRPVDEREPELLAAVLAGDRAALDRLLRNHFDRIYALCRRLTGNDADGADAAQEALIAITRGLAGGRFDGRSRFSTWAYRVATNACLDEMRRRSRRPQLVGDEILAATAAPMAGVDRAVADRVDIDRALGGLPLDYRTAVVLRDLCQLDYGEIAEVLDIPTGTVRSRIARGRAALADRLGNPGTFSDRPTPRS